VVVVSEETGTISMALGGEISRGLDATSLNNALLDALGIKRSKKASPSPTAKTEESKQANI